MTRRFGLVVLFGLLTLPAWPSNAPAQTKVKFALDSQIQGPQAPFISAKAGGAFAAQGLDVTIDRGTGSQKTIACRGRCRSSSPLSRWPSPRPSWVR